MVRFLDMNMEMSMSLTLQTVYNNSFNSSWNASGVHPGLVDYGSCVNYDSYATITLDGPASYVPGAEDPSLYQDSQLSPTLRNSSSRTLWESQLS